MASTIVTFLNKHLRAGHGFVLTPLSGNRLSAIRCECGTRLSLRANKSAAVELDGQAVLRLHCSNPQCRYYPFDGPALEVYVNTKAEG
ncbi:MAG: hypothetical protein ACYC7E_23440 [Armatimonadota bacterium]